MKGLVRNFNPIDLKKIQQIAPHSSLSVHSECVLKKNSSVQTQSWFCQLETNKVAWTMHNALFQPISNLLPEPQTVPDNLYGLSIFVLLLSLAACLNEREGEFRQREALRTSDTTHPNCSLCAPLHHPMTLKDGP